MYECSAVPSCVHVSACVFKIVLLGQKQWGADWIVNAGFVYMCMHVLVSVCTCLCVCVYESLFVYTPASI